MKKIIILISMILLLSGCSDYVEVNDLVIISGMIIDYNDNQFEVTSELIINDDKTNIKIIKTTDQTIEGAIAKISEYSNKDIFLSQLKVLILTENIIKNDIDYYDYFLRNSRIKMNFYVYTINDEDKDKIFNIYKDKSNALYIEKMMEFNSKVFSSSTPLSFIDLIHNKLEYGIEIVYPLLIVKNNNDDETLYLDNLVTFNKDKKIDLNLPNSVTYNILNNNIKQTIINIPCDDKSFSINVQKTNTKFKFKNNIFYINLNVNAKLASSNCKFKINDKNGIKKLIKLSNSHIKNDVNNLIKLSKNNNIDFIGFGNYIYKHNVDYFDFKNKNWNDNLKNIQFKINVDTNITSIGEMKK